MTNNYAVGDDSLLSSVSDASGTVMTREVDPVEGGTLNDYVYALDPISQHDLSGKFLGGFKKIAQRMQQAARKVATRASVARVSVGRRSNVTPVAATTTTTTTTPAAPRSDAGGGGRSFLDRLGITGGARLVNLEVSACAFGRCRAISFQGGVVTTSRGVGNAWGVSIGPGLAFRFPEGQSCQSMSYDAGAGPVGGVSYGLDDSGLPTGGDAIISSGAGISFGETHWYHTNSGCLNGEPRR